MSAAIKCDRCGAFYEVKDAGGYLKLTGRVETKGDLCEDCSTELRSWFRAPKNKDGRRHVKPRAIEDVLRDVWKEALDYAKSDIWRNPDEVFAERADEIRKLPIS